jgi:hypothetical protein
MEVGSIVKNANEEFARVLCVTDTKILTDKGIWENEGLEVVHLNNDWVYDVTHGGKTEIFLTFKTRNGFAAALYDKEGLVRACYLTKSLKFNREMTESEWVYVLLLNLTKVETNSKTKAILIKEFPKWEHLITLRSEKDYSWYKAETCNNGGDYAFFVDTMYFRMKVNRRNRYCKLDIHSTTAEFDYDELGHGFQSCGSLNVVNTILPVTIKTQTKPDENGNYWFEQDVLEKISESCTLDDILNHECYNVVENTYTKTNVPVFKVPNFVTMGYDVNGHLTKHWYFSFEKFQEELFHKWCDKHHIGYNEGDNPYIVKGDCQIFVRQEDWSEVLIL